MEVEYKYFLLNVGNNTFCLGVYETEKAAQNAWIDFLQCHEGWRKFEEETVRRAKERYPREDIQNLHDVYFGKYGVGYDIDLEAKCVIFDDPAHMSEDIYEIVEAYGNWIFESNGINHIKHMCTMYQNYGCVDFKEMVKRYPQIK